MEPCFHAQSEEALTSCPSLWSMRGHLGSREGERGIRTEDTPRKRTAAAAKWEGEAHFPGHLGSSLLGTDHPLPGALMEALADRVET